MFFVMVKEIILYMVGLISVVAFMLLVNTKFKFKNKVLLSLAAPIVGGLFILLGAIFLVFLTAVVVFGGIIYLVNKKKFQRWMENGPRFGINRYY